MMNLNDLCNCGKPIEYSHLKEGVMVGSCNKYSVCASYDDLLNSNISLNRALRELLESASAIMIYRENTSIYKEAVHSIESIRSQLEGNKK